VLLALDTIELLSPHLTPLIVSSDFSFLRGIEGSRMRRTLILLILLVFLDNISGLPLVEGVQKIRSE
jgi:hypothetical protein